MNMVLQEGTIPYRRLMVACGILKALDHHNVEYRVENTYHDYVAGDIWTTIICSEGGKRYQALDWHNWTEIMDATTAADVVVACCNVLADRDRRFS